MSKALYRKFNDRSCSSSTYHKRDGTAVRAILKRELERQIAEELGEHSTLQPFGDEPFWEDDWYESNWEELEHKSDLQRMLDEEDELEWKKAREDHEDRLRLEESQSAPRSVRCFCGGRFAFVWADDMSWKQCGSCGMDLDTCRAEFG